MHTWGDSHVERFRCLTIEGHTNINHLPHKMEKNPSSLNSNERPHVNFLFYLSRTTTYCMIVPSNIVLSGGGIVWSGAECERTILFGEENLHT